jgi:hypothetical protein
MAVALTDTGRGTTVAAVAAAADITAATLEPLTAREAHTIVRLLEKLR